MFRHLQDYLFRNMGTVSVLAKYCVKFQYIRWTKKVRKLNEFRCHSPPSELYSRGPRFNFTGIQQAYTDLTYSKEQSCSWAINRFSASQEIARILWNPKVHHRVCKSLPPVPIQSPSMLPHPTLWRPILLIPWLLL